MTALIFLRTFAKPILALLLCMCVFFAFQYYNHLQQKVGRLEASLTEKQTLIDDQNQNIADIKKLLNDQAQAISDLQKVQDELQVNSEQRKITIKEIFNHDSTAKSWASQPVPDAIRGMFNTTSATNVANSLSSDYPVQ